MHTNKSKIKENPDNPTKNTFPPNSLLFKEKLSKFSKKNPLKAFEELGFQYLPHMAWLKLVVLYDAGAPSVTKLSYHVGLSLACTAVLPSSSG